MHLERFQSMSSSGWSIWPDASLFKDKSCFDKLFDSTPQSCFCFIIFGDVPLACLVKEADHGKRGRGGPTVVQSFFKVMMSLRFN